jgi:Cytochrome C biogenesis protein transmembrane region
MIELPLVFLGGLLGSAHCVGMCGGFALTIGIGSRGLGSNLRRQLIYTAGRIFTYSFFGLVAGYAGLWIAARASIWINIQASLSLLAGVLLLGQCLLALGMVPRRYWPKLAGAGSPCLAGTFDRPGYPLCTAHAGTGSRSLSFLWRIRRVISIGRESFNRILPRGPSWRRHRLKRRARSLRSGDIPLNQ